MAPGADRLLEVPGSPCGCRWMGPSPRFILEELTTLAIIQAYKSKHQLQQATNFWMFVANRHLEIQQMNEAVAICCRDAVQVGLDGQPVMMCWLIELEFSIKRRRLLELSQLRLSRMMCAASCERGSFWWFHGSKEAHISGMWKRAASWRSVHQARSGWKVLYSAGCAILFGLRWQWTIHYS